MRGSKNRPNTYSEVGNMNRHIRTSRWRLTPVLVVSLVLGSLVVPDIVRAQVLTGNGAANCILMGKDGAGNFWDFISTTGVVTNRGPVSPGYVVRGRGGNDFISAQVLRQ